LKLLCRLLKVDKNGEHMTDLKVLIIDDEVEFASTLCQRLQLRSIDATDIHSGGEGLTVLKEIVPDVVILDLKMPDMSGLDVLAEIKKYDPDIEVIMLTGHGSANSGIEAMEKGAFDYIMKPVDLQELLEKINLAVDKRSEA
jgi:DNA-binding NtrC family response regulator